MFTLRGALSQLCTHRAARTGFCVRTNAGNYRFLVRGTLCTCENFQLCFHIFVFFLLNFRKTMWIFGEVK